MLLYQKFCSGLMIGFMTAKLFIHMDITGGNDIFILEEPHGHQETFNPDLRLFGKAAVVSTTTASTLHISTG